MNKSLKKLKAFMKDLWSLGSELWNKIPEKRRYEFHSFVNTIIAAMIFEFGQQVYAHQELLDPTMITHGLLIAIGLAAVRAAWKAGVMFLIQLFGFKLPEPK